MANSGAMSRRPKLTPRELASKLTVLVIVALVAFGGYLIWSLLSPVL